MTQLISLFFIISIIAGTTIFRPATARTTSFHSRDQVSCTMCDACDNPCQPSPSPPPPSPPPAATTNCPPPPSPPLPASNPPPTPTTPSAPNVPYYPPPSPDGGGGGGGGGGSGGGGGYGYPTPPPPNPILPYFPFYYYNPPPAGQNSESDQLIINRNQISLTISLILLFLFGDKKGVCIKYLVLETKNISISTRIIFPSCLAPVTQMVKKYSITIRYLGGKSMLLTFYTRSAAEEFLNEKDVWKDYFEDLEIWKGQDIQYERVAWIRIHGIPIQLWNREVTDKYGGLFGEVVHNSEASVFRSSLAYDAIGIVVKSPTRINEVVEVKW
ncbi:hypothetical protein SSX86_004883 [Deinandra increscens subsp. villosa]|uniref:DUF4283 domain-containing protein n=1 Tax=Deinandra increscens subsp. villosa TaxID=3103831 RepID=A0AAP0DKD9_9ASTR